MGVGIMLTCFKDYEHPTLLGMQLLQQQALLGPKLRQQQHHNLMCPLSIPAC